MMKRSHAIRHLQKFKNCRLKRLSLIVFFLAIILQLSAQDEYETCSMEGEAAWEGDTVALQKFVATCGKIDTLNLDSLHHRAGKNASYQQITMRLNNGKIIRTDSVYFVAETMPQFKSGANDIIKYLHDNIRYPAKAMENKISGTVLLSFIVSRDGSLTNIRIERGLGVELNVEAIRLIKAMPKWTPGKMKGKPVRVHYTMPIKFKLS